MTKASSLKWNFRNGFREEIKIQLEKAFRRPSWEAYGSYGSFALSFFCLCKIEVKTSREMHPSKQNINAALLFQIKITRWVWPKKISLSLGNEYPSLLHIFQTRKKWTRLLLSAFSWLKTEMNPYNVPKNNSLKTIMNWINDKAHASLPQLLISTCRFIMKLVPVKQAWVREIPVIKNNPPR